MKIVPFDYMVQDDQAFCPKCSCLMKQAGSVTRHVCKGTILSKLARIVGITSGCPSGEHFHRECGYCNGKWVEAIYDESREGARVSLYAAFDCVEKVGMSEEDIVKEWRMRIVRGVMQS
jgi:hypothetical protein